MKFKMNSPLMEYLDSTAHFIALNFLFLVCCIPIVTIGPAVAALYQVLLKESRGEHGYLLGPFLKHFKEMFLQGLFTFIFFIIMGFVLSFGFVFWNTTSGLFPIVANTLTLLAALFILCAMIYVFPIMARFDNSFVQTIRNAFLMAISHKRATCLLLIIHLFFIALFYLFPAAKVFMLMIGFSFVHYLCALIFTRVFKCYEAAALNI